MRTLETLPRPLLAAIVILAVGCSRSVDRRESASDVSVTNTLTTEAEPASVVSLSDTARPGRRRPVIGHLATRDHMITIHSGDDGPAFTVATSTGDVLETGLTPDQLQSRHPAFFQLYTSAIADDGVLDASLWPHEAPGVSPGPKTMLESVELDR